MTLSLRKRHDHYVIINDDADFIAARIYPLNGRQGPYRITSCVGPSRWQEVGVVKSLDEAIPIFLHYYEKHPVPWEPVRPALYCRDTMFVCLRVEQDQQGHWRAYRDDYPLLQDTKPASFATCIDARRAADAHELDLYPNAKVIDDGFSWLPDPEIGERGAPHLEEAL